MSLADYDTVIGLETHVQLKTKTKMFCGCPNAYGAEPNTLVCPVCLGLPGALPVVNKRAFELGIRAGLALDCGITRTTKFDRKNYFYPDLPKGYQISQFDQPLNHDGGLSFASEGTVKRVRIKRAHLEEDAGKNQHGEGTTDVTLVDMNRCGVPLLEIVTEADITSATMAFDYLTALKLLLRCVGVSDCDMEKGSLRVDVNISLKRKGVAAFGTKIELKNINSFRYVRHALEFEQARQAAILDSGGQIDGEETRLWDSVKNESRLMRRKEGSADYRYFPDPDLPIFHVSDAWIGQIRESMPELPAKKRERFMTALGLPEYDAGVLVQDPDVADYFEETARLAKDPKQASNWVGSEVFSVLNETGISVKDLKVTPKLLADLILLTKDGTLNVPSAREVFHTVKETGADPKAVAESKGLMQVSDEAALREIVKAAIEKNPKAVADLKQGKGKAAGAIVGFVMGQTKGRANPAVVNRLINEVIGL